MGEKGMTCLLDLLIEYNNCDVGPFISALESFQIIFDKHDINVFSSNAISAPGLSYNTADNQNVALLLFDTKSSDLFYSFKKQCYEVHPLVFIDIIS